MDIRQDESNGVVGKSSYLCRQSSTRWIPTAEQIRILRELYYANGVRSPNAEQIQKISARLRQFGKIEGKNVFYWFQNHKARERQKKRLSVEVALQQKNATCAFGGSGIRPMSTAPSSSSSCADDFSASSFLVGAANTSGHASPAVAAGVSPLSGVSFLHGGQMGDIAGYGSVLMERGNFRECYMEGSLFSGAGYMAGKISEPYGCFDQQESIETDGNECDVETLQLFPLRGSEESEFGSDRKEASDTYPSWYFGDGENDRVIRLSNRYPMVLKFLVTDGDTVSPLKINGFQVKLRPSTNTRADMIKYDEPFSYDFTKAVFLEQNASIKYADTDRQNFEFNNLRLL